MKKISVLVLIALFLVLTGFKSVDKNEKRARQQMEVAQLINSGRFKFIPSSASSSIGNINHISYGYEMVFDSLNINANLPYFGRSYASFYRFNSGVKFELQAVKIEKKWNERKKMYTMDFDLAENRDSYLVNLSLGLTGFANLRITFFDRESISYYGTIEKIESKNK